jgi:hypothetical protein
MIQFLYFYLFILFLSWEELFNHIIFIFYYLSLIFFLLIFFPIKLFIILNYYFLLLHDLLILFFNIYSCLFSELNLIKVNLNQEHFINHFTMVLIFYIPLIKKITMNKLNTFF